MFTGSINIFSVGSIWQTASVSHHLTLRYLFFIKPVSFMSISVIRLRHRSDFFTFFPCISMKIAAEPKQLGVPSTCVFRPPGRRLIYSVCFFHGWLRGVQASQINTGAAGVVLCLYVGSKTCFIQLQTYCSNAACYVGKWLYYSIFQIFRNIKINGWVKKVCTFVTKLWRSNN